MEFHAPIHFSLLLMNEENEAILRFLFRLKRRLSSANCTRQKSRPCYFLCTTPHWRRLAFTPLFNSQRRSPFFEHINMLLLIVILINLLNITNKVLAFGKSLLKRTAFQTLDLHFFHGFKSSTGV